MFLSLSRYSVLLLALILTGFLAACSSTSTSSGASRATRSVDAPPPAQQAADDSQESPEVADSTAAAPETQAPIEPAVVQPLSDESEDVSRDAEPETGSVDEMVVFPEQPYEIEVEEDSTVSESAADAEIERLRRELAATESELDRMRDEQSEQDYDSGQTVGAGTDGAPDGQDQLDYDSGQSAAGLPEDADATTSGSASGGAAASGGTAASRARTAGDDEPDLSGKPAEFSIYFGYDESSFDGRFEPVVVAHAEFLKANPGLKVEIQGNCDERGSREYNIALGQRRAEAVKRALELLGVQGNRIETVSFGAEKPVAFGRDEESYRLNRRADIVY